MTFTMMQFFVLALTSALAAAHSNVDFDFVAREYIPAGYKEGTTTGVPDLYVYFLDDSNMRMVIFLTHILPLTTPTILRI
jgi:hypothetical protein